MTHDRQTNDHTGSGCERFREEIEALLFDQPLPAAEGDPARRLPTPPADGELGRHLGECVACAELLALHAELLAWEDSQPAPSAHEEARLRRRVLETLRREAPRPVAAPVSTAAHRIALAAGVLLALAAAFLGGRLTSSPSSPPRGSLADEPGSLAPANGPAHAAPDGVPAGVPGALVASTDLAASLLDPIAASLRSPSAATERDPSALDQGPYSFDNVQLHDLGGDRVRLSFDYSIHLDVERHRRDPLVTAVLVDAILDGGSLGTQLKAIGVAEAPSLSPRLRAALVRTMLEDESAPARQAALERLLPDTALPDVESALLQVLEHEPSVHMRLLAIDALAAGGVPRRRLEQALDAGPAEPGQALRLRVGALQRDL
jgi:hypothetical protein